jgi:hypothetical protein
VDGSPIIRSYLRFDVTGVTGTVTRATLRLYTNSKSSIGCDIRRIADNSWGELIINYNNAPTLPGDAVASSGPFSSNAWITLNLTSYIPGNGTYSIMITTSSSTAFSFASRQAASNNPQLIIETTP